MNIKIFGMKFNDVTKASYLTLAFACFFWCMIVPTYAVAIEKLQESKFHAVKFWLYRLMGCYLWIKNDKLWAVGQERSLYFDWIALVQSK